MKVVGTSNFDRDYFKETLMASNVTKEEGKAIADKLNVHEGDEYYYLVKEDSYVLRENEL